METVKKLILLFTLVVSAGVVSLFVVLSHGFDDAKPRVAAALAEVKPSGPPEAKAKLQKVINGHVFVASVGGSLQTVRLVGMDTPVLAQNGQPSGCYGIESATKLQKLLQGKELRLTPDPGQPDRDVHKRLLRYVITPDGKDVGQLLVEEGLGKEYTYHTYPHPKQQAYRDAQSLAIREVRGLWSPRTCGGSFSKVNPDFVARTGPDPKVDPKTTCAKFKTRFEALRFYEHNGGPYHDFYKLDPQRKGQPCNHLP